MFGANRWDYDRPEADDPMKPHMDRLSEWAAGLPDLPSGYQYRFESDKFDVNGASDETTLTMRAIPEKILYFEED